VPPIYKSITLTQPRGLLVVALWKVHRAKVVASAEADLGGGRKSLEKASLVQVLGWHLGEIGIYEAMLE
jgi:hypothetical protein